MKQLLTTLSQKWAEYLLEILVITIGILGAFALNNWNESRQDRAKEQTILIQLKSELESNLAQLNEKIGIRKKIMESGQMIFYHMDNHIEPHPDSLYLALNYTRFTPTFDPILSDLTATSDINLIQNRRLKRLLSIWTSELVQVTEEEQNWLQFQSDHYLPFLIETFSLRNITHVADLARADTVYLLEEGEENFTTGRSKKTVDPWKALITSPEFEDYLTRSVRKARVTNIQSISIQKRLQEILELIESELD